MQPVMIFSSDVLGALYLNGRYAGEVDAETEAALPVAARGPLVIEHRPLVHGYLPLARRLTLSGGNPIALTDADGVEMAAWPGGALEMLLTPEPGAAESGAVYDENGLMIRMEDARGARGAYLTASRGEVRRGYPLPEGARMPEIMSLPGTVCLTGDWDGGAYLIALGDDVASPLLSVSGREAGVTPGGEARALEDIDDVVGHARLTRWTLTDGRFIRTNTEHFWTRGAPEWPQTPESTALAALQAARLGLVDEARAYLAPGASAEALEKAADAAAALPLKYPLPDGRSAVGLVEMRGDWLAVIRPVFYHASPLGGPQGVWRLDRLTLS